MNRGVLITPFHSMLLMCPATAAADVDAYVRVLEQFCTGLQPAAAPGARA
jgi:glutamate-1-semialdehyde 2,1-aminomutase